MAGPLALRSGGSWTGSEIDTSRAVLFPGFFERQESSYDADTGQLFGEIAYPTMAGRFALEPFAGLAYVSIDTDAFRERGGVLSALAGSSDVPLAQDSFLLEAGLDLALSATAMLGVSYTGQLADDVSDNGIKGHRLIELALRKASHDPSLPAAKRMELRGKARNARAIANRAAELEKRNQAMSIATEYAKRHREYLETAKPHMLKQLKESGRLIEYLKEIGEEAAERYESDLAAAMNNPNLPKDYAERGAALEALPLQIDEIVRDELIYQPR